MNKLEIAIMGHKVVIYYNALSETVFEWHLDRAREDSLLLILLRIHYSEFIEAQIREDYFEREFHAAQQRLFPAHLFDEDVPF